MTNKNIIMKDFLQEIEKTYGKYFTNSKCVVEFGSLYKSIYVRCYLVNNKNESINNIVQNDMFSISFSIKTENGEFSKDINLESLVPENLVIEVTDNSYTIKPELQYMAYGRRKLNYRKTKGDSTKLLKTFDKYFKKLSEELKKDIEENNIHDNHIQLLKEKLI